jgi:UDP-N-acetylglucosamine 2-epimerase (non-hydrolysing)
VKIIHVVGSHSGFFRISPVFRALRSAGADHQLIVYAGHREDLVPRDILLQELELPSPAHVLGVSTGSSAVQTGRSLIALEAIVQREAPDWIFAVGDVDASLAAALVGRKNGVPLAHLEAGLRSGDSLAALEINRLLTDRLADALFVAEEETRKHLISEGIEAARVHFVGNTAADTVARLRGRAASLDLPAVMGEGKGSYVVARLARTGALPGDVALADFLAALDGVAAETGRSTVLVLDASAAADVREQGIEHLLASMTVVHSPSYVEMLALVEGAGAVVTNACEVLDSATVVGVPSVAIGRYAVGRASILEGIGHVSAAELDRLPEAVIEVLAGPFTRRLPDLWDGRAASRIAEVTLAHRLQSVA